MNSALATGKADLHIHSTASDGTASVDQILSHVRAHTDLKVIAITDHDCLHASMSAAQRATAHGLQAIVGEEISTQHGHVLALFIEKPIQPRRHVEQTIADIHAQGGLAIAAHPFDRSVPSVGHSPLRSSLGELGFDGIEGFNAGVFWRLRACNSQARELARSWKLPIIGGSDAHSLATIGSGYTRFAGRSAADVYRAIKAGETGCGGEYWRFRDYLDSLLHTTRIHGLGNTLRWVIQNSGQPTRAR